MGHDETNRNDRRAFLQVGALATASALGTAASFGAQDAVPTSSVLPRRPLGKTGVDVTILDQGTGKGPDVDRLLRFGFARGVRFYDTSETYHSEAAFKRWFAQDAAVRKEIFLVTKDAPKTPHQLMGMLDKRLVALGTDYQARQLYAGLSPEARDWSGADLEATRAACPARLDFARLLPEVERQLA